MLYLDQVGGTVAPATTRPGVHWVRLETDVPNAVRDAWHRKIRVGDYLRSLRQADTEAVFARDDVWPGLLELALTPYLALRRGL